MAIYSKALTTTQISNHYTVGSSGSGYETTIEGDGPIAYWPLKETSGTTATDLISGKNGTYVGGVTLGSASGIPGDSGTTAALLNGTSGYVSLPSNTWLTGGDYTVEGWTYKTVETQPVTLFLFQNGTPASPPNLTFNDMTWVTDWPSNAGFQVNVSYPGMSSSTNVGQSQMSLTVGAWDYFAVVYHNGGYYIYQNGSYVPFGADVTSSTFEDLGVSGADIGLRMDSQHGCICYNMLTNVSAAGSTYGAKLTNSSGYAFGINQDQWTGGRLSGAVGLWDSGDSKFTFNNLDFENDASSNGAILYAGVNSTYPGSGYNIGDTVQPAGGSGTAVLTVAGVWPGGSVTSLTVATAGTGYSNAQNVSTTTLTGSGAGLVLDIRTGADMMLLSPGGSLINNPYEEAGAGDYICGTGNFITGAFFSASGASYSPTFCSQSSSAYGGPLSDFVWGPGAVPNSIGVASYIFFGGSMWDNGSGGGVDLYENGPVYAQVQAVTYGTSGHSPWKMGLAAPYSGVAASGKSTFSQLANPTPTLTAYGGTGTTSAAYGLVCNDANGGTTLPATPTATVSGPATLGALLTLTIVNGGSGYVSGDVGTYFTVTGGDSTGQGTITAVSSGAVTGVSLYAAGSQYPTVPSPGSGQTNVFATSGGTGTGLAVAATSTYVEIAFPVEDGCASWTVLKGDTTHRIHGTNYGSGSTNQSANIIDFGAATVSYSPGSRNTTGDVSVAGNIAQGGSAVPITVASGSLALATSQINSGVCQAVTAGTTNSAAATGVLTTDVVEASFNGDPTGTAGYEPGTSGMLAIIPYPTAGYVNFKVCNNTASAITPGAITLNWRVTR